MTDDAHNTSISEERRRANTRFLGLDVNLPVFSISSGLAVIFSVLVLIYPEISYELLTILKTLLSFGSELYSLYLCPPSHWLSSF